MLTTIQEALVKANLVPQEKAESYQAKVNKLEIEKLKTQSKKENSNERSRTTKRS